MSYHQIPLFQSPLGENTEKGSPDPEAHPTIETHDATLFENPQFQHYEETTNIQLFFDLFFVANLTSFTNAHEVNSLSSLSSYIGFFCILWFTWCQVTLYDVRFSTDSVFERIAHLCHFGVMIGLAVVGPQFNDPKDTEGNSFATLQQLSLILMTSRLVLLFQYASTLYFSWRYRTTRLPLAAVMTSLAIAAVLYLGLSFAFSTDASKDAYLAWYIVAVFEVGANIAVAGRWHVLSFKGTHLVERMTCLTLIILGEGVIGLTKSITKIETLDFSFTPGAIGTIVSALFVIYFVYQLYFDNVQLEHFGIIRQQIWTFLHFPFHMALVLLMEGTNQFVSWRHVIEYINLNFDTPITLLNDSNSTLDDVYNAWNLTIETIVSNANLPLTQDAYNAIIEQYGILNPAFTNVTTDQYNNASQSLFIDLLEIVFDGYGFEPPETEAVNQTYTEIFNSYFGVFDLIFAYFFICAGVVLISLGVLAWISLLKQKGHNSKLRYVGIISNIVFGIGLALVSTLVLNFTDADNLGESVWTLPILVFVLFISLILNHIPFGVARVHKE